MLVNRNQSIKFRFTDEFNAEFILSLRFDVKYNKDLCQLPHQIEQPYATKKFPC